MVLSSNLLSLLSDQYSNETANSIFYTALQSWADMRGLDGTASFLASQAQGERTHADKVLAFIHSRNEEIQIKPISEINPVAKNYQDLFLLAQIRERNTTEQILKIYQQASIEGDFFTCQWLLSTGGLIAEQVEEENTVQTILDRINARAGGIPLNAQDVSLATDHGATIHDIDLWLKTL